MSAIEDITRSILALEKYKDGYSKASPTWSELFSMINFSNLADSDWESFKTWTPKTVSGKLYTTVFILEDFMAEIGLVPDGEHPVAWSDTVEQMPEGDYAVEVMDECVRGCVYISKGPFSHNSVTMEGEDLPEDGPYIAYFDGFGFSGFILDSEEVTRRRIVRERLANPAFKKAERSEKSDAETLVYITGKSGRPEKFKKNTKRLSRSKHKAKYHAYLKSPQWKALRDKVVARDKSICQGCLEHTSRPAVHHMTYDNIFEEFAFELITLCNPCHDRFHGKS